MMLESYLVKILDWLESGAMWLQEEIPTYVQELITYYIARNWFLLVTGILICLATFLGARKMIKHEATVTSLYKQGDSYFWLALIIPSGITGVLMTLCHSVNLFQLYLAPRVWLVEYVSQLLSN